MRCTINPCLLLALALGVSGGVTAAEPGTHPPRILREPVWTFPPAAEHARVRQGEAHALLSIGANGELVDFLVTGCTHPAFAEALAEALPEYRFAPARVRGEPRAVRYPVSFTFQQSGTMASVLPTEVVEEMSRPSGLSAAFYSLVSPPAALDRPVTAVHTVPPRYPEELRNQRASAEVTVDFIIDAQGRVRLPAVETNANPGFAREATAALLEWRFEPPTRRGQPTLVKAVQVFRFPAPPAEPTPRR